MYVYAFFATLLRKHIRIFKDSFLNSLSISLSNNGNPHTRGKKFEFFGAKTLFLRPSTISLFESLLDTQRDPLPIFLDGPRGAGKSATLLMTAQHFTSQNWLVLYEPMGALLLSQHFPSSSDMECMC